VSTAVEVIVYEEVTKDEGVKTKQVPCTAAGFPTQRSLFLWCPREK